MILALIVTAALSDVIIGGESRLTLHNTEIVSGKWIDDESWYWSGNGVRGCFSESQYSSEKCRLRIRFVGRSIKIFGELNGKGIRTHFHINNVEVHSARNEDSTVDKSEIYYTTNIRSDEVNKVQILEISVSSDFSQPWSMESGLLFQNYISITHVVVDSRDWYPPEAFYKNTNERGLQSAVLTRSTPFSAAEIITTGMGDARGQIFIDGSYLGYLSSGLSSSVITKQPSYSLDVVFASNVNLTNVVKGVYVTPTTSGSVYSINFGSTDTVFHNGVRYLGDPTQSTKEDFLKENERFVTNYLPSYNVMWGDGQLPDLMKSWKESKKGEVLTIPLEVRPGGRYILNLVLGVNVETSVSEDDLYFNTQQPLNGTESELRFTHKSQLTKALQSRCTVPVAARYFAENSQLDLTVANVANYPTTRFDPFIGSYCSSNCVNDWKIKYYCSPVITLAIGDDVVLEEFELGRLTGGLHVPISISQIIEVPSFGFSTQITITPQEGHVAAVFGLSLTDIGDAK